MASPDRILLSMAPPGADRARVVLITHPEDGARAFATALIERRIAACVNQLRVQSVYRWRGTLEEGSEVLLVVKTTFARLQELEAFLSEKHPYEVPECVVLQPAEVARPYLDWLLEAVERGTEP